MRKIAIALVIMGLAAGLSFRTSAQSPVSAAFPTIVIFDENAGLAQFAPNFRADDRAAINPPAWGYLDPGVAGYVQTLERLHGFRADHIYSAATRGFAARLNARQIQALENDPAVKHVEPDGVMRTVGPNRNTAPIPQVLPWGIDRIEADLSSTLAGNGSGTVPGRAYIIDTGVDTTHTDLNVKNFVNFAGGPNRDCDGHGTHVAGTVAARDNATDVVGVAPGMELYAVKVLGCSGSGTTSGVIKGIDWVTNYAVVPAVANMSLGGGASKALDDAVLRSVGKGIFYAVAAGNESADACNSSPARTGVNNGVMAVAATDNKDLEASWSNYGSCVDIWAPGVSILSTKLGGGTTTMSGTSMASPHVAGTAALYLSSHNGNPADVEAALKSAAIRTTKTSKGGTTITIVNAGRY
jgi:subtilisin family serine protease